jgi:hypothetical protein
VACPTAKAKDYALERWYAAYLALETDAPHELVVVDTTPDTTSYQEKLVGMGINCAHIQPPYWPKLNCLIYTVSKAWELIVEEAWACKADYILSLESDVIAPPETLEVLLGFAVATHAQIVAHSYPYVGYPLPPHSLGCMLIERTLFEPGEELHKVVHPGVVEVGSGGNFEDMVWNKPITNGGRVVRLDNFIQLEHLQVVAPPHGPGSVHG